MHTRLIPLILAAGLALPGYGQNVPRKVRKPVPEGTPAAEPKPTAPAATVPDLPAVAAVPLSDEAFRINSVGLTMHLPEGSQVQTSGAGDLQSVQVMDKDKTWLINIRTPSVRKEQAPEVVARQVRDQLLAVASPIEKPRDQPLRNGVSTAKVLQDIKPVVITADRPAEARTGCRFYVSMPRDDNGGAVIRGYTVFGVGPGRYVTFELVTQDPTFAAARAAYETTIATARFADAGAMSAARGAAIEAGITMVSGLAPADYDAAIGAMADRWYRLARSDKDGAEQEVAYRRVRAWKGKRGQVDPSRDPKKWAADDLEEGYLVRIDARYLQDGKTYDSVGSYFMTPDRRGEAWLLQMVIREPGARKPATWREVGARTGTSMSVATDGSGESKVGQPAVPAKGYLNQVETFLLPQLLLGACTTGNEGGGFGFYSYQSEFGNIRLRRDDVARVSEGQWTITTRMNEDREPQVSTYAGPGELVRTGLPDGGVWTPITLPRLAEIWKAKNLPMD